jgi:hypothetical protein
MLDLAVHIIRAKQSDSLLPVLGCYEDAGGVGAQARGQGDSKRETRSEPAVDLMQALRAARR